MGLRGLLHNELDRMLDRDGGPNHAQYLELTLSQGNSDSDVKHVAVVDPKDDTTIKRYVRKAIFRKDGP